MRKIVDPAEVKVTQDDGKITILADGSLDFTNLGDFQKELKQAVESAEDVVVNLRTVDFIDSAVLEDLARAGKIMIQRGKRLKVICLEGSHPLEVLRISMLDRLMDVMAVGAEDR